MVNITRNRPGPDEPILSSPSGSQFPSKRVEDCLPTTADGGTNKTWSNKEFSS
ncbi:hypothetical protein DBR06_SOUSAS14010195, partial [Sousa chinensis]